MQRYIVIWRGDEDDFFFTALDLEAEHYARLTNNQIIQMCWDVEYPDELNPYGDKESPSYDLLEVLTGDVQFVGRV